MNYFQELLDSYNKLKKRELRIGITEAEDKKKSDKEVSDEEAKQKALAAFAAAQPADAATREPHYIKGSALFFYRQAIKTDANGQAGVGKVIAIGGPFAGRPSAAKSSFEEHDEMTQNKIINYFKEGGKDGEGVLTPEDAAEQSTAATADNLEIIQDDFFKIREGEDSAARTERVRKVYPGYDPEKDRSPTTISDQSVLSDHIDPETRQKIYENGANLFNASQKPAEMSDEDLRDLSGRVKTSTHGVLFKAESTDEDGNEVEDWIFIRYKVAGNRSREDDLYLAMAANVNEEIEKRNNAEVDSDKHLPLIKDMPKLDSGGADTANRGVIVEKYVVIGLHISNAAECRKKGDDACAKRELDLAFAAYEDASKLDEKTGKSIIDNIDGIFHRQINDLLTSQEGAEDAERMQQATTKICDDKGLSSEDCDRISKWSAKSGMGLVLLTAVNAEWNNDVYNLLGVRPSSAKASGQTDSTLLGRKDDVQLSFKDLSDEQEQLLKANLKKRFGEDALIRKNKKTEEIVVAIEMKMLTDESSRQKVGESGHDKQSEIISGKHPEDSEDYAFVVKAQQRAADAGHSIEAAQAYQQRIKDHPGTPIVNELFGDPAKLSPDQIKERDLAIDTLSDVEINRVKKRRAEQKDLKTEKGDKKAAELAKRLEKLKERKEKAKAGDKGILKKLKAKRERQIISSLTNDGEVTDEDTKAWVAHRISVVGGSEKEVWKVKRVMATDRQSSFANNQEIQSAMSGLTTQNGKPSINVMTKSGSTYTISRRDGDALFTFSIEDAKGENTDVVAAGKGAGEDIPKTAKSKKESTNFEDYLNSHMKLMEMVFNKLS